MFTLSIAMENYFIAFDSIRLFKKSHGCVSANLTLDGRRRANMRANRNFPMKRESGKLNCSFLFMLDISQTFAGNKLCFFLRHKDKSTYAHSS